MTGFPEGDVLNWMKETKEPGSYSSGGSRKKLVVGGRGKVGFGDSHRNLQFFKKLTSTFRHSVPVHLKRVAW